MKLVKNAAVGSQDMVANFTAVTSGCNLDTPNTSPFYLAATTRHAGGASAVFSTDQATTVLNWISEAKATAAATSGNNNTPTPVDAGGGGEGGAPPAASQCAPVSNFNLGEFQGEILPMLFGQVDYNQPVGSQQANTTGCARGVCHGTDRADALVIKQSNTPAQNLASFACYVNFTSPIESDIVNCPLNRPGCKKYPHPGQTVFSGVNDLNYQKMLSYLYASKTANTPLDFAFFSRRINTIFNDPNVGGAPGRTCADTNTCHGVSSPTQLPPNGSYFPILADATDKTRLLFTMQAAANFANFVQPEASNLFLFPTNEIANPANKFNTGRSHPGGTNFAVNSQQAQDILNWVHGLRPDGNGFQPNWLVAGDYPAINISDRTPIDEVNTTPSLFDPDFASQFNNGQWDANFSANTVVDLNASFPRAATSGRVAYAVSYVLNTTPNDIQARVTVTSPNAVELYVGNTLIVQSDNAANGISGAGVLVSNSTGQKTTRLLIKVLQRQNDQQFNFQVQLADDQGVPLTNVTGELVMKLQPEGGI